MFWFYILSVLLCLVISLSWDIDHGKPRPFENVTKKNVIIWGLVSIIPVVNTTVSLVSGVFMLLHYWIKFVYNDWGNEPLIKKKKD